MAADAAPPVLRLRHVGKSFPGGRGDAPVVVVDDVSLDIAAGEFVCIVGPSGCGKSTLLNLIAGLEHPSTGTVEKDGAPVTGPGPDRGVMFQDYALYPWQTVEQNVGFGLRFGAPGEGLSTADRKARVARFVELVSLRGAEHKYPHQLSGGMRQRVALARLLANEPDVLLMDEPLGALDAQTRLILQLELLHIWGETQVVARRKTALFITHDIEEAVFLADRVVVMSRHPGRIRAVIDIDLPRPRDAHTRAGARFGELSEAIWELIRDEALQAI
jgi:NitT/TauT family transport system ATP-binding protein